MPRSRNPVWLDRACLQCNQPIRILESQTRGTRGRFCCRQCARCYQFLRQPNISPMSKERYAAKFSNRREKTGRSHHNWREPIKFACVFCQRSFTKKPWQTRGSGRTNAYCSVKCRSEHRKTLNGPNAPDYVGGPLTYRGRKWPTIRLQVVEDQAGNCERCKRHVGRSLPVHHIRPFREFTSTEEANRRDNLVGMCQSCHMKTEPRPRKSVERVLTDADSGLIIVYEVS